MSAPPDGRTRDLEVQLARALGGERALDIAHALGGASNRARAYARLVRADGRDCVLEIDDALNLAGQRAFDLARVLDPARGFALDLASALEAASDLVRILFLNCTVTGTLGLDLDLVLESARGLVTYLETNGDLAHLAHSGIQGRREMSRVAPAAGRLVMVAARMLPARERVRYAAEFRSELWEIARADGRRRAQLEYAARLLMAARRLRAELREPRRRGAVP